MTQKSNDGPDPDGGATLLAVPVKNPAPAVLVFLGAVLVVGERAKPALPFRKVVHCAKLESLLRVCQVVRAGGAP